MTKVYIKAHAFEDLVSEVNTELDLKIPITKAEYPALRETLTYAMESIYDTEVTIKFEGEK